MDYDNAVNLDKEENTEVEEAESENPTVGMLFDNEEVAYSFYNGYARLVGFSVRKHNLYCYKGVTRWRVYTCSWEGQYKKKSTPKKKRDERRSGCKAMLRIQRNENGKYVVTHFVEEHNHHLVRPQDSYTLRSHRYISDSQKSVIQNMRSSGIKTTAIIRYLSTHVGGVENLNFLDSDCHNLVSKTRTEFLKEGDAQCLLEYLENKKKANKFFYYKLRADENNRLCSVFIADPKSRADYGNFGDVICFDTTFRTNKKRMICAPIVGVNHHGQTVLFGCGLLDRETIDAFVWLFHAFLEAMGGKHPLTIFTDQAMAIAKAISRVFPKAVHRLCLWHIFLNAGKNLKHVFNKFKSFATEFKKCIYNPENIQEFEQSWKNLLSNYGLGKNPWMQNLYQLRAKWAMVYAREYFCAGMSTTQRSESINSFLKKFFKGNLILREFVVQFDNALTSRRSKERVVDADNRKKLPNMATPWAVELEASKKFTRHIFGVFQAECLNSFVYKVDGFIKVEEAYVYSVRKIGKENVRRRTVTYTPSNGLATCSCKKFEFQGILCAHILKLFLHLEVSSLPSKYYLQRWSREATTKPVFDSSGEMIRVSMDSEISKRYGDVAHYTQILATKASRTKKRCDLAVSGLRHIISKVDALSDAEEESTNKKEKGYTTLMTLLDPVPKDGPADTKRKKNVVENKRKNKRNKSSTQADAENDTTDIALLDPTCNDGRTHTKRRNRTTENQRKNKKKKTFAQPDAEIGGSNDIQEIGFDLNEIPNEETDESMHVQPPARRLELR